MSEPALSLAEFGPSRYGQSRYGQRKNLRALRLLNGMPAPDWWDQAVASFLADLIVQGRAERTAAIYLNALDKFGLMAVSLPSLEAITRQVVQEWQRRLARETELGAKTRQIHHASLRSFLKWAAENELVPPAVYLAVKTVRVDRGIPRPLDPAHFALLKAHFEPHPRHRGLADRAELAALRDRALFWFLYSTASRISAALQLDRDDFHDRQARVIQKGGREHILVSTNSAAQAITDFMEARKDDAAALFIDLRPGRPPDRLTKQGANLIWEHVALEVGIPKFTSHQLRHTGLTDLYASTGDILLTSKHAGHASVNTTAIYAKVATARRLESLEALEGNVIPLRPFLRPLRRPQRRKDDPAR